MIGAIHFRIDTLVEELSHHGSSTLFRVVSVPNHIIQIRVHLLRIVHHNTEQTESGETDGTRTKRRENEPLAEEVRGFVIQDAIRFFSISSGSTAFLIIGFLGSKRRK
jgi:hypothetical protein